MQFHVIFDMDGVLVNSNPAHKQAIQEFCTKYGFQLSEDQMKTNIYGRTNKEWITNLFGTLAPTALQQYATEKEALYRTIFAPTIAEVAGLTNFLAQLQRHGIRRAIATSAPLVNVEFTLKALGIEPSFFEVIVDESWVEHGKPNPEVYLKTAQALGVPVTECIVFEDSLSGVAAGVAAGMKVVGITTTHTPTELAQTAFAVPNFEGLQVERLAQLFAS